MSFENELCGCYLSHQPVTEYRLKYNNKVSLESIDNYFDKNINIILYVDRINEINTKKNDKMMFITASDELSNIDLVLFPNVCSDINNIAIGDIIEIFGKVEKRFDKYQIIVSKINVIEDI